MVMRRRIDDLAGGPWGSFLHWLVLGSCLVLAIVAPLLLLTLVVVGLLFWVSNGPGGGTPVPVTGPARRGYGRPRAPRGPPRG